MFITAARGSRRRGFTRDRSMILPVAVTLCCLLQTGCMKDRYIDAIPVARVPREILQINRRDDLKDISVAAATGSTGKLHAGAR